MAKNNQAPFLRELQTLFAAAVTGTPKESDKNSFLALVARGDGGPTPAERLHVYAFAWEARLDESLRDDYPALSAKLGAEAWANLRHEYLRQYPSTTYTLAHVGDHLPKFLAETTTDREHDWQSELASLERAVYLSRYAADTQEWRTEHLASMNETELESLRFRLAPSAQLFHFAWNVVELNEEPARSVLRREGWALVFRQNFRPRVLKLTAEEYRFLRAIEQGASLGTLVDGFEGDDWTRWLAKYAAEAALGVKS